MAKTPNAEQHKKVAKALRKTLESRPLDVRVSHWWHKKGDYLADQFQLIKDSPERVSKWQILGASTGMLREVDQAYDVDDAFVEALLEEVWSDETAFDLAKEICVCNLVHHKKLHTRLQEFAAIYMNNPQARPVAPHRPREYWYRDMLIVEGIDFAKQVGLKPTRNETSSTPCGISLVSEALSKAWPAPPSYNSIHKIWKSRKEFSADLEWLDCQISHLLGHEPQ